VRRIFQSEADMNGLKLFNYIFFPWLFANKGFLSAALGVVSAIGGLKSGKRADRLAGQQTQYMQQQADIAAEQWDRFKETFAPLEDEIVSIAMEGPDIEGAVGEARADVQQAFQRTGDIRRREMGRYGIDPFSGRGEEIARTDDLERTKAEVFASNKAREAEEDKDWSRKLVASSLGRGIPGDVTSTFGNVARQYGGMSDKYRESAGRGFQTAGYHFGKAMEPTVSAPSAGGASRLGQSGQYGLDLSSEDWFQG
jgi:hypothetical protein